MTEYLEKAALVRILRAKAEIGRLSEYSVCFDNVAKMIELLPAADVAEVKHGKWIEVQKENIWNDIVPVLECSACGKYTVGTREIMTKSNYCPNCGAKMDLED